MKPRKLFLVLPFLLVPLALRSSGGDRPKAFTPPPTTFECRFADAPVKITGKGTDPAWKKAQIIDNFYLPWLGAKARAAKTKTVARLLWDREYIYFFAEMEDSDLYADVKEHDGMTWDNDVFELFFKPSDKHAGYYEFQVNAAGTILDMFLPRRGAGGYQRFAKDGKFHVEAKVHLDGTLNNWTDKDKGWSVEGRIPWTDFMRSGGRPEPGESWKFALCRYDYSVDFEGPELSTCAPLKSLTHPDFHHHEDYATLRFVGPAKKAGLPPGLNERIALTTSKVVGFPDPPPPYRTRKLFPDLKLDFPICVVRQPGSDLLLTVHANRSYGPTKISRFKDDPKVNKLETLFDLTDTAYDIVFHPKFAENGYFYVGSNGASDPKAPKKTRVTRYTMDRKPPYAVDPKSKTVIIDWDSDGHNGAAIAFGLDGMMYVTAGDGTSDSDTNLVGQDMSTLLAKVLRIDVDHPDKGEPGGVSPGETTASPRTIPSSTSRAARESGPSVSAIRGG
ncbi:MAG: sugar-binding protein [Gemmataceae bacterium]